MEITKSFCCRDLKNQDVLDSSGQRIGRITDMTFTFDGNLRLSQFILGGSAWEEFLESVGIRPDSDPVFDFSLIQKMDKKVHLSTSKNVLRTTLDECAIRDEEIRLSELERKTILDKNGVSIGRSIDIDIEVDGSVSLIVGGGFIEELLEGAGLKHDVDVVVPGSTIDSISEVIKLNVSKQELKLGMDDAVKVPEQKKAKREKVVSRDIAKVQLFHRPF